MNSPYNGKFKVTQCMTSKHDGLDLVGLESKEVHSTVVGVVERAGWENSANHSQGFGLYVRIKKSGTNDRYYYGHLSQLCVAVGQSVVIGDVIGIEGSTGYSTGSHCHYCVRGNASKSEVKNVSIISGIPNALGTYDDGYLARLKAKAPSPTTGKKSNEEIANEVIDGKWANGQARKDNLEKEGYDYSAIQKIVNEKLRKK